jgi:hypothetical protein
MFFKIIILKLFSGIAVGVDGKVFIADGTNIRQVDENGIITTLIGNQVFTTKTLELFGTTM